MISNYKTYRPKYAILVRDIKLTDEVHKRGNPQYVCRNKRNEDCCVVVRKKCKGYSLVSGWGGYMECVMQGYQTVKAVITNDGIGKFCRQCGEKFLPIEKVIVPDYMARTTPAQWKIERVEQRLGDKKTIGQTHNNKSGTLYRGRLHAVSCGKRSWYKVCACTVDKWLKDKNILEKY